MLSLRKSLAMGTIKGLGAFALGGAILWQVTNNCGSTKGMAYVHVVTPGVDVTVDDQRYRVETLWESPIVCELGPGRHTLRMLRSGRVLFEQEFTLDPSQEVVLTAWEGFNDQDTAVGSPKSPGPGPRISPGCDRCDRGDFPLNHVGCAPFRSGPVSAEQTPGRPP
jgi:hypothetical protein